MSGARKARMLRTLARREHVELAGLLGHRRALGAQIAETEALIGKLERLRAEAAEAPARDTRALQSDRFFALQIAEQAQTLRNRLDFLTEEAERLSGRIVAVHHKGRSSAERAEDLFREDRAERAERADRDRPAIAKKLP